MKFKLVFCLFNLLSTTLFSQDYKGKFFIETGVKASGGADFVNFIGKTGFSYNKLHWTTYNNDGSVFQEDSYNTFSWAIAPRFGYYLSNSIHTGIDIQYYQNILSLGGNYRNFTTGLFFRFNDEGSVSYITQKTHKLEINPMLSISYIFGRTPKTQ